MFKGVKGSENGVKGSEKTNVQSNAIVLSLPFTPFHFLSLLFFLLLSPLPLHSQQWGCGVKVKAGDMDGYREALDHYEHHRYGAASKAMWRVAQRNPKAADPQFWMGMIAVKNGFQTGGIRRYFTKCIELCPTYPNGLAHFYKGVILYTDEHYEGAVAEFDKYFRLAEGSDDKELMAVYEEASVYLHWSHFLADAELNKAPFDPHPLAGVSTKRNETLPFITHDGSRCYFLREVPVKSSKNDFYNRTLEQTRMELCCSEWKDTAFAKGKALPKPFNSGLPEGGVSVTADGRHLYFSRITQERGYANSDLYHAEWRAESGEWKVERLGNGINGEKSWESQPSVSADGRWLYFASDRKGGKGGMDIWRCHRLKNGDWSRPENLGTSINTTGNEKFPFLHADGHTLYFVSDGWQGFGGYDVYFADFAVEGIRPTNLGLPINSENDELSFCVTADGSRAYFPGRMKSSRSMDILMFDLYPAARPEPMRCCRMRVESPRSAHDTVFMLSERELNTVVFSGDSCLPYIATGKAAAFSDKDVATLYDSITPLYIKPLSGSRLSAADERTLDAWAAWFFDHPRVHAAIECPKITDAKAVYDYLLKKKLRAERLSFRGGTDIKFPQIRATD